MTIATNSRFVRLLFLSIPPSLSLCSAKESTYGIIEVLRNDIISIHAPARGATTYLRHTLRIHTISIHAPARGATCLVLPRLPESWHFNPRSREGSDQLSGFQGCTWGYFNPRSREGSDGKHQDRLLSQ